MVQEGIRIQPWLPLTMIVQIEQLEKHLLIFCLRRLQWNIQLENLHSCTLPQGLQWPGHWRCRDLAKSGRLSLQSNQKREQCSLDLSVHFEYIPIGRVCHRFCSLGHVKLLQRTCGQICPSTTCMRQHGLSVMGPRPGGELARRLQARGS